MDLGKLLPTLLPNFPAAAAANGLFNANSAALSAISGQQQQEAMRTLAERRIASRKLVLNGFVAYLERTTAEGETERVNIVTIPQFSEEPLETIPLEVVKEKFPPVLGELFRKGPPDAFFLVKCWANVEFDIDDNDQSCLYAVDSFYDSPENFELSISSRVCSFRTTPVEKVEVYSAIEGSGPAPQTFQYRLEKSPMCEYMAIFMRKLKSLEDRESR
ncbi:TEA domain-containing protein [Aphelenchoides fujianensis]|nr:TEA domain-containing protein [Aphelenchoides fujianensis]